MNYELDIYIRSETSPPIQITNSYNKLLITNYQITPYCSPLTTYYLPLTTNH